MALSDHVLEREKAKFKEIGSGGTTIVMGGFPFVLTTMINGTTTAGTADSIDVRDFSKHTVIASVTQGTALTNVNGTVVIQGSIDNSIWIDIEDPESIVTDSTSSGNSGAQEVAGTILNERKYGYLRALVTNHNNGTITVKLLSGN